MRIIIDVRDTALLSEIEELDKVLQFQKTRLPNVIKAIRKEL